MLERFPSVHEQGSRKRIGLMLAAVPEQGVRLHPEVVPRVQEPVSDGVRHHPPLPRRARRWDPPIKSPACIFWSM